MSLGSIAVAGSKVITGANAKKTADVIEFLESGWGLKFELFPVQKTILKSYYNIELDNKVSFKVSKDWTRKSSYEMTEKEYLEFLYNEGRSNIKDIKPGTNPRKQLMLNVGRRSGKTTITAGISAYETYKLINMGDPQAYYGLPSSNVIQLVSVATDREQAGILYNDVSSHFRACSFFSQYTANNTQTYARFQTPKDIERYGVYAQDQTAKATIRITFKSCIAKGLRGSGNILVIMDEMAHFIDKGQSSADAVYTAVAPSTSAFSPKNPNRKSESVGPNEAKIILISSPLGKQGTFYEMFQQGMAGDPETLCIQAPTWEVNPSVDANELDSHYRRNPTVFFTEYGAEFSDRTRGWIERESDLTACIDKNAVPQTRGIPRKPHFLGLDLGLVGDGTAAAVGHISDDNVIVLDTIEHIKAGEGKFADLERLDFDDVADWVKDLCSRFYIIEGLFDQWSGIPFEQALTKRGLNNMHSKLMDRKLSSQVYQNFKTMMWDHKLRLFDYPVPKDGEHCSYISELLELQAEFHTKFVTTVAAPNIEGKHDDMSDALVRMVWVASNNLAKHGTVQINKMANQGHSDRFGNGNSVASLRRKLRQTGSHESRQVPRRLGKYKF